MSPLSRRIYKTLVFSRFYIENRERYTMFKSIVIELRCQRPPVSFLLEKKLNLENHLKTNIGNIFTTWNIFGGNFSLFILAVYERLWSCLTVLPPSCDWLPVVRMIVSRRVSGRAWTSTSLCLSPRCPLCWWRDPSPPPPPRHQASEFRIFYSSSSYISYVLKYLL